MKGVNPPPMPYTTTKGLIGKGFREKVFNYRVKFYERKKLTMSMTLFN